MQKIFVITINKRIDKLCENYNIEIVQTDKKMYFLYIQRNKNMGDFIDVILSNTLYLIIMVCILSVMIFFVIKKMTKFLIYASIILIAFLSYVYYTDESITSAIKPVQGAVEKAEKVVK
jgi:hypothetical protein